MMKTIVASCLALMAGVSAIGQAQTINTSHSKSVPLSARQNEVSRPALSKQQPAMSPVLTRAIAQRDDNDKLVVKCHVESSPAAHGPRGPERNSTHKKVN